MALFRFNASTNKLVPITSEGNIGLPVGAVVAFPLGTTQQGWLLCNGRDTTGTSEELQTHYPALYTYLGNSNVLPEKYETSKDTRVFMTVNDPQASLSGNIQIENASHVTSIEVAGTTRANQHDLARLAVDLTTATSLLFGFGGSNYTTTINGTYNSTNDTWTTTSFTGVSPRGLFINYDELVATETRRPLYIKATSAGIEVDKDLYATKGYIRDQNVLSDYELINLSSPVTMQYDGILIVQAKYDTRFIYVNDVPVASAAPTGNVDGSGTVAFRKGDVVRLSNYYTDCAYAAYYKLRDYTGR